MANPLVTIEVDTSIAERRLNSLPARLRAALRPVIVRDTQMVAAKVAENLSGAVLNKRSGRLLSAERQELVENSSEIFGRVWMDLKVAPYAAIQEYGGTIKHPGSSKFQAWQGPKGWVYTNYTKPHDIPIPARSYLNSAIENFRDKIVADMRAATQQALKDAA